MAINAKFTGKRNTTRPYYDSLYLNGDRPAFLNGQNYTITGSGFGAKAGYTDHINTSGILSLSDGSNFGVVGRWDGGNYSGVSNRFAVTSGGINGKYIQAFQDIFGAPGRNTNSCIAFNYDSPVALGQKIFSSRYVKHSSNSVTGGQWKYERYQKVASVVDKAFEAYWNASSATPDNKFQVRSSTFPTDSVLSSDATVSRMPHSKDKWVRMDTLITLPTAYEAPDSFKLESWVYDPDGALSPLYKNFTVNQAVNHTNPYDGAGCEWTQHLFQNYLGNGDYGASQHYISMDKMFESVGDQRRVELCNSAVYSSTKRPFVQPIVSWTDTQIVISSDAGDLPEGARWLHVVDDTGSSIANIKV